MIRLFVFMTFVGLLAGRAGADDLRVAVSIEPHAWLVEQVAGKDVNVTVIVPPDESPATYAPTDAQITAIMRTRVFFRAGVPFERGPWFKSVSDVRRLPVVDLRDGIELRAIEHHHHGDGHDHDHDHDHDDPHTWLSPENLAHQAATIAKALGKLDADRADEFERRAEAFAERMKMLDESLNEKLAPYAGRAFLVYHPAWGYFADDHELRQIAIEVAGQRPTDVEITKAQRLARREKITTVFVQPQISDVSARAIAESIDGRVVSLNPIERDVEKNLRAVADALIESFGPEDG